MFTSSFTKLAPLGFAVALLFLTVDGTESRYETWLQHYSPKPCENCDGSGKICWSYDTLQYSGVKCVCKGTGTNKYSAVLREMENLDKLREHLEGKIEELNPLIKKLDAGAQCDSSELEALQDLYFKLNQAKEDYGRFQQELIKINKGFVSYLLTSHSTCDGTCSDEGTEEDGTCSGCDKPWRMNIQYNQARRLAEATQGTETLEMKNNQAGPSRQNATLRAEYEELIQARAQVHQTLESGGHNLEQLEELKSIEEKMKTLVPRIEVLRKIEKLEMKLAALSNELIEKMCDPNLPLTSFEFQDLRWQIIQTKDGIEHFKQELEELTSQLQATKNNQAPGPSRAHPVCPEPLMAE